VEGFSKEEQLMLEDYKACLAILRHEDGRKSHLFTVFFVVQGALFGLYGLAVQSKISGSIWLAGIAISLSLLWFLVMERMRAFAANPLAGVIRPPGQFSVWLSCDVTAHGFHAEWQ
jgi:hypothetical protein